MEQPLEGFESVEELHRHRATVLGKLPEDTRAAIGSIEEATFGVRQTRVENIYGVVEKHARREHLRDMIALCLKRHPKVQFTTQQIAEYLHCTEDKAVQCVQRMEIEIVERAGSTTSQDFMVVEQQLGVVISELVRTFA